MPTPDPFPPAPTHFHLYTLHGQETWGAIGVRLGLDVLMLVVGLVHDKMVAGMITTESKHVRKHAVLATSSNPKP